MTSSPEPQRADRQLHAAIVLRADEDKCTVIAGDVPRVVSYALPFPRPRAGRITPGNLVALAATADGSDVILWRWFDAVVLDNAEGTTTLWEPNHGTVVAQPRDQTCSHRPGSRAYLSAGLPGAEWWLAGPAVDRAESADVELDEVHDFCTDHGLWDRLA